jgi:hypothetical protein
LFAFFVGAFQLAQAEQIWVDNQKESISITLFLIGKKEVL